MESPAREGGLQVGNSLQTPPFISFTAFNKHSVNMKRCQPVSFSTSKIWKICLYLIFIFTLVFSLNIKQYSTRLINIWPIILIVWSELQTIFYKWYDVEQNCAYLTMDKWMIHPKGLKLFVMRKIVLKIRGNLFLIVYVGDWFLAVASPQMWPPWT